MKMGPVCSLLFSFDSRAADTKRTWSPASDGPGCRKFASRKHEKERKKERESGSNIAPVNSNLSSTKSGNESTDRLCSQAHAARLSPRPDRWVSPDWARATG